MKNLKIDNVSTFTYFCPNWGWNKFSTTLSSFYFGLIFYLGINMNTMKEQ